MDCIGIIYSGHTSCQPDLFTTDEMKRIHVVLDCILLIAIVCFPYYLKTITTDVSIDDELYFAKQRSLNVEANAISSDRDFSAIKNLVVVTTFLAMALHYENDGTFARRWRAYGGIGLALIYGGLTGTKGNAVWLILTLAFITALRGEKLHIAKMAAALLLAIVLFGISLLFVSYQQDTSDSLLTSVQIVSGTIQNYWLGGLIAFEQIYQSPDSMESTQHLNRFFLETANGFGANFTIPSIHAAYTNISPYQDSNTYTIYISYFKDFGWTGVLLSMLLLGYGLTWNFLIVRNKKSVIPVMYSSSFAVGLLLSVHAEHFILSLNFYIKFFLFFYFIYYFVGQNKLHEIRSGK